MNMAIDQARRESGPARVYYDACAGKIHLFGRSNGGYAPIADEDRIALDPWGAKLPGNNGTDAVDQHVHVQAVRRTPAMPMPVIC